MFCYRVQGADPKNLTGLPDPLGLVTGTSVSRREHPFRGGNIRFVAGTSVS
jgi:hypothetical protein